MDDPELLLGLSAEPAINTVGTTHFEKLTRCALTFSRKAMTEVLTPADESGIFLPVCVRKDDKDRLGAMLLLDDRLIIYWQHGTIFARKFRGQIPRNLIRDARSVRCSGGFGRHAGHAIEIQAARKWTVVVPDAYLVGGSTVLPGLIAGILDGSMTLKRG